MAITKSMARDPSVHSVLVAIWNQTAEASFETNESSKELEDFPGSLMDDMASKIFQAVPCPTQLFQ